MSAIITLDRVAFEAFNFIPDSRHGGTLVDWNAIKAHLEEVGLGSVARAMFGEPLNMSRNGDVFTARGKAASETLIATGKGPIRVFVEPVVVFTLLQRADTLYITDIAGVAVQHKYAPNFTRGTVRAARVRMRGADFLIDVDVSGMIVPLIVDQQGNVR